MADTRTPIKLKCPHCTNKVTVYTKDAVAYCGCKRGKNADGTRMR